MILVALMGVFLMPLLEANAMLIAAPKVKMSLNFVGGKE